MRRKRGSLFLGGALLLLLPPLLAQPRQPALKALAEQYLALPRGAGPALERHEKRLELLAALERLDDRGLEVDDRADRELLLALLRRDLYWLMGPETDGRLPLPGFFYRRVFDPELEGPDLMRALHEDLRRLPGLLGRDGGTLGVTWAARRRRLGLLETLLANRLPFVAAHAGRWKPALRRATRDLLARVRRLGRTAARRREGPAGVGVERYRFLLNRFHLVPLDPDAVAFLGRQMMARTRAELRQVARRVAPGKSWRRILAAMGDDHPPLGELPAYAQGELQRAIRFVEEHDLVSLPPGARRLAARPWAAVRTYPYGGYLRARRPGGMAHYGVPDLTLKSLGERERRARLRDNNVYWTRVVAVHEGVPGHHLQFVFASRNPDPVRRRYYSHVYGEGWALYCEELMYRHGYYPNPKTRLAQLKMRLWRALRMVIDVGLHCQDMPVEEAVGLLVKEVGLARASAASEVRRYLKNPTRPASYILGYLMIMELREAVAAEAGEAFDEKRFHDFLLRLGPIPLELAREAMLGPSAPAATRPGA